LRPKNAGECTDYAGRLTTAIQGRLAALDLPTSVTVNITLAPEGVLGPDAYDEHAPSTYPRNVIEQAIDDANHQHTDTRYPCPALP
jgi:hypothetical protein